MKLHTKFIRVLSLMLTAALLSSSFVFAYPDETPELETALHEMQQASSTAQDHEALDAVLRYFSLVGVEVDRDLENLARLLIDFNEYNDASVENFEAYLISSATYNYVVDEWNGLTDAEKALAKSHPVEMTEVALARKVALDDTMSYWGYQGSGDGCDAYRHMLWNGLMTIYLNSSARAKVWADAHEEKGGAYLVQMFTCGFNGNAHTHMDLYNNQLGRDAAVRLKKASLLHAELLRLIETNVIYTIHPAFECEPV